MSQEKNAKEVIVEILEKAEFILSGFEFSPELDKNSELLQANVNLSLVLVDKDDESLSAKDVIEKYMLGEDETLLGVLEKVEAEDEGIEIEEE